jgi:DNA-binding IclR family transcriptional regulator
VVDSLSGVGVLDKAFTIVDALEAGPHSLNDLVAATGLSRATAHRLAVALEAHGMVRRVADEGPSGPLSGRHVRFALGLRLLPLAELARPALERLRDETGESAQLYVRQQDARVCVLSLESPHGLRTIVPLGATLSLDRGSAGRVLLGQDPGRRGWIESVEEREPGVASVSAPVRDAHGNVLAAVSVSGPINRMTRAPGRKHGAAVAGAAAQISSH